VRNLSLIPCADRRATRGTEVRPTNIFQGFFAAIRLERFLQENPASGMGPLRRRAQEEDPMSLSRIVQLALMFTAAAMLVAPQALASSANRCAADMQKEYGKYYSCALKAQSKATRQNNPADLTRCQASLDKKLARIVARHGDACPEPDTGSLAEVAESCVDDTATVTSGGIRPTPGDGADAPQVDLTQESVADVVAAIYNADILTNAQMEVRESYLEYTQQLLSVEALAVQAALLAEIEALGIEPNQILSRRHELSVPLTDPDWMLFQAEAEALYDALPGSAPSARAARFPWLIPAVIAVAACDFKIIACSDDVNQQYGDCLAGRLCGANQTVNKQCCANKMRSDLQNCLITCGLNGPDGDYGNCCMAAPAPSPSPPPALATPIPTITTGK
jgi:hypothetical protein